MCDVLYARRVRVYVSDAKSARIPRINPTGIWINLDLAYTKSLVVTPSFRDNSNDLQLELYLQWIGSRKRRERNDRIPIASGIGNHSCSRRSRNELTRGKQFTTHSVTRLDLTKGSVLYRWDMPDSVSHSWSQTPVMPKGQTSSRFSSRLSAQDLAAPLLHEYWVTAMPDGKISWWRMVMFLHSSKSEAGV